MKEKTLAKNTNHVLNRRIFDLAAQGYSYSMIQLKLVEEGLVKRISTSAIGVKLRSEGLRRHYYADSNTQ